jgi:hypothetical protein
MSYVKMKLTKLIRSTCWNYRHAKPEGETSLKIYAVYLAGVIGHNKP